MRQLDVYRNPSPRSRRRAPYLVVLPHRFLLDLPITLVAPLLEWGPLHPMTRLNPMIAIEGGQFILSPLEAANIPTSLLHGYVTNLESERDRIIAAFDFI